MIKRLKRGSSKVIEDTSAHFSKQSEHEDDSNLEPRRRIIHYFICVVIFAVACLIVGILYVRNEGAIETEMYQSALLPPGIPRFIPFPRKLITIEDTYTEDYTYTIEGEGVSSEEKEGIKYTIEGSSDLSPKKVRDFYNDLLLDQGFRQRINISLPSGHRVDLVSEEYLVSVEAEVKSGEERTRVKIIVYD